MRVSRSSMLYHSAYKLNNLSRDHIRRSDSPDKALFLYKIKRKNNVGRFSDFQSLISRGM